MDPRSAVIYPRSAVIKVIGVGGGGCNAVNHMIAGGLDGVDFIGVNTDAQALGGSSADTKIVLGAELTHGLGAGANPEIGRQAALEDEQQIREALDGSDLLFINAGMGGGTGTGAASVIARIAKELGTLTVGVVTLPFKFEGNKRMTIARDGIAELRKYVDSLIILPNDKLLSVLGKNMSLIGAFQAADNVSFNAVQGIAQLITQPGLINVDFADVRTVMSEKGMAMMGTGIAPSAREATEQAIKCPLLEGISILGAQGILVNITGGPDMNIGDFEDVGQCIQPWITDDATVVIGTVIDRELTNQIRVTIVVTGIGETNDTADVAQGQRQQSSAFEQPAYLRRRKMQPSYSATLAQHAGSTISQTDVNASAAESSQQGAINNEDLGYLNIPAFLRRQQQGKNKTPA